MSRRVTAFLVGALLFVALAVPATSVSAAERDAAPASWSASILELFTLALDRLGLTKDSPNGAGPSLFRPGPQTHSPAGDGSGHGGGDDCGEFGWVPDPHG